VNHSNGSLHQEANMSDLCVILGNGPSLRGFDFFRLQGVTTLGMNAAYRYWDEIGWYPTYYACLDDQLIKTHHEQILRLWGQGRCSHFFVHGTFFDHHPQCICAAGFTSLDQVLPHWYHKRGKEQGWSDLTTAPAFLTKDTTKVTTGSFATRFASYMGHTTLALMGIDLRYVEVLPEAESTGGIGLVIRETPRINPNYFFDGYQQTGDRYNIPNPKSHDDALHIQSFRLIKEDFVRNGLAVQILNVNPTSLLEHEKVFPLQSIDELLTPHELAAVVVPATKGDIDAILSNFEIWNDPRYSPLDTGETDNRCALVFAFNNRDAEGYERTIREKFASTGTRRYFSRIVFHYLGLDGEADRYERSYSERIGEQGYKAGPNNQFFLTISRTRNLGRYVFHMETDCVPLRRGWLSQLRRIAADAAGFWVMGSTYRGIETLSPSFRNHLNGNAIYAVGDPAFQEFVSSFWEPRTRRMVAEVDRRLAYDCILEKTFTEQRDTDPEVRQVFEKHRGKFRVTEYILNISGKRDLEELSSNYREELLQRFPDAYILHNRTAQQRTAGDVPSFPRLLIIDMTAMGNSSATGELKANLLRDWPRDRLLQIASPGNSRFSLVRPSSEGDFIATEASEAQVHAAVAGFFPELILYRPVSDLAHLHALAIQVIKQNDSPLVTWIMDDWPARLHAKNEPIFETFDRDLRHLLERSVLRLSICDRMSQAFEKRYGHTFTAVANGIEPSQWPPRREHRRGPMLVRYAGGLATDMNAQSVLRVARAVEALVEEGSDIRFEIATQTWWLKQGEHLFKGLKATRIEASRRSFAEYAEWLRGADVLLIAYNFDERSQVYVRYSMANKLPECMASGAALLVHGPIDQATVDYASRSGAARVVDRSEIEALKAALEELRDPARRNELSERAYQLALERHSLPDLRHRFAQLLTGVRPLDPNRAFPIYLFSVGRGVRTFIDPATAQAALVDDDIGLVTYDDPAVVLADVIDKGGDPVEALAEWEANARAALALHHKARHQLTLFERSLLIDAPALCLSMLGKILSSSDELLDMVRAPPSAPDSLSFAVARMHVQSSRSAPRLLAELRASGRRPDGVSTEDAASLEVVSEAHQVLRKLREVMSNSARELAAARDTVAQAEEQVRVQNQKAQELQKEIENLRIKSKAHQAISEQLKADIDAIYRSRSWKVTRPLRAFRRVIAPPGTATPSHVPRPESEPQG
jgi:glycosyltransferase involved in cell wall biosynthesis